MHWNHHSLSSNLLLLSIELLSNADVGRLMCIILKLQLRARLLIYARDGLRVAAFERVVVRDDSVVVALLVLLLIVL